MNLSKVISKYKYILLVFILIYILFYILFFNYSNYSSNEKEFLIYIKSYKIENNLLSINGKGKENIKCFYTFKDEDEINRFIKEYNFGDYIIINGSLSELSNNTIPNNFNYKKYALSNNEYYSLKIDSFYKYKSTIRSYLYKRVKPLNSRYLDTFLFGSNLDNDDYKVMGLSSLFTSFSIILILFKKNNNLYLSILLFLLISTNFNIKIIIILLILLLKRLEVNYKDIVFIITIVKLLDRPLLFINISFYYVIVIYLTIIFNKLNLNKILFVYLINLVLIPINIYSNYLFNIFYYLLTPLFSILLIPLGFIISILLFIFPIFTFLLKYFDFLDFISQLLVNLNKYSLIIMKPSIIFLLIIYILIFIYFKRKRIIYLLVVLLMYISLLIYPHVHNYQDIYFIDVGEGDAALLRLSNLNILIDTGNKNEEKMITFFHSLGISKLDLIIITHGDLDHIGNTSKIIEDIKVNKLYFNSNELNENESILLDKSSYEIIDKKDININNIYLHMESYNIDDENSASIMTYLKIDDIKLLFLGDSSIESTNKFINNIEDIDVLKVSHHGSKYNTNKDIINKLNPKVSVISVGKNNRYGHPNKETIENLSDSKIYRTDQDGSIMFKIKNNKLRIETCSP